MNEKSSVLAYFKLRYPQILEKAEVHAQQAEKLRSQTQSTDFVGFLWEHSLRVSQIAYELAIQVGTEDTDTVVLAALLHDIGKFSCGEYHTKDIREEEISAEIAEKILFSSGLSKEIISEVKQTIRQLYSDESYSEVTALIHDADRLDKTGMIGLASFFQKWTLRGLTLSQIIEQKVGSEITYLANLKASLKTSAAKELSPNVQKSIESLKHLIFEYNQTKNTDLSLKCYEFEGKKIYAVERPHCLCGGSFVTNFSKAQSAKCELVLLERACTSCDNVQFSSICFSRL